MEDVMYIDELQVYLGRPYRVNDYITIKQPTVGQIASYGEKEYYSMVTTLVATPSDMMSELDDMGVNFMEIKDFDLFMMMCRSFPKEKTSILFGDLDFTELDLYMDQITGEPVLANIEKNIKIDRLAYLKICKYLRLIHNLEENRDKAANETTRKIMIKLDRDKKRRSKKNEYQSQLKILISAMMRYPGFKYKKTELEECGIYEFMDTVRGAQIYVSSTALLQGSYSGFVDTSKISKEKFNWLRSSDDN